jgi:transcriptional regulator with XRE-family HTH domain
VRAQVKPTQRLAATKTADFANFLLAMQFEAKEIGARIAKARKEAGLSQEELAEMAPFSKRSLQDYEGGVTIPYRHLQFLGRILGREIDWFLHGTEETNDGPDLSEINAKLDQLLEERVAIPSPFWETALEVLERDPAQASASVPELEAAATMLERASEATLALASRFREAARTAQRSA